MGVGLDVVTTLLVFSTNKTDHHDITEILLKVALNTINQTNLVLKGIFLRNSSKSDLQWTLQVQKNQRVGLQYPKSFCAKDFCIKKLEGFVNKNWSYRTETIVSADGWQHNNNTTESINLQKTPFFLCKCMLKCAKHKILTIRNITDLASDCCLNAFFNLYRDDQKLHSIRWWCPLCNRSTCVVQFLCIFASQGLRSALLIFTLGIVRQIFEVTRWRFICNAASGSCN